MSYVEVVELEAVGRKPNIDVKRSIRKIDVTGMEDRKNDICKICGRKTYPECGKTCSNFNK